MQDAPNGSNARRTAILLLIKYLPRYYYDPKDPEGRAGHKTQIRCPDWGAKGREIQVLKRQHNIYFRPMMYRGGLPGSCTSQVEPRVWLEEDRPGFREIRCRRRRSSGVGARFLPGRVVPPRDSAQNFSKSGQSEFLRVRLVWIFQSPASRNYSMSGGSDAKFFSNENVLPPPVILVPNIH
ncbi:hypothetical protein GEV33_010538 [Tenebrio molitor]|uniref:Uncharacterized protein n=1 Tax=Tenebrio molitor TaxID=7067 RepID=A0A8J6HEJ8_TENMO|nr:hypothetical protein GEV33_010538 [Tenebrio molitor]